MNADFPQGTRDQSLFLPLPPLILSLLSFSCTPSPAASPVNHVNPFLCLLGTSILETSSLNRITLSRQNLTEVSRDAGPEAGAEQEQRNVPTRHFLSRSC